MMSIKIYITLLLSVVFISSCEKIIEFNGEITDPQVVVYSFVSPDSVVSTYLTESRFFLSSETSFKEIENADVSLFVNGVFNQKMVYKTFGKYESTYTPQIGDTIQLELNVPTKSLVSATTIIEPHIDFLSLDTIINSVDQSPIVNYNNTTFELDTVGYYENYDCNFKLKFQDDGSKLNYYRLVVHTHTVLTTGETFDDYSFTFDDIVSGKSGNSTVGPPTTLSSNEYNVFNDELFDGKEYNLAFHVSNNSAVYFPGYEYLSDFRDVDHKTIYVDLQSISKGYYLYLKSRDASNSSNGFFSEPIQIYNNINGGIGVLGSFTSTVVNLNL